MRSTAACAWLSVAALLGCGGNSTGAAGGDYGITPSSGSSNGNGSATGNGGYDPTNAGSVGTSGGGTTTTGAPQTCDQNDPCPSGQLCSARSSPSGDGAVGYCVQPCTLPDGTMVGQSNCPGGEKCVRGEQATGVCELLCDKVTDCATIVGLDASCAFVGDGGPKICVWSTPPTPGGR